MREILVFLIFAAAVTLGLHLTGNLDRSIDALLYAWPLVLASILALLGICVTDSIGGRRER